MFTPQDARPTAGVVIVNEAFEKHYFPGESAIGKRIRLLGGTAGGALADGGGGRQRCAAERIGGRRHAGGV